MAVNTDPAFAVDLQTKIAQSGNTSALVAFSAVVGGDIKLTAATGYDRRGRWRRRVANYRSHVWILEDF